MNTKRDTKEMKNRKIKGLYCLGFLLLLMALLYGCINDGQSDEIKAVSSSSYAVAASSSSKALQRKSSSSRIRSRSSSSRKTRVSSSSRGTSAACKSGESLCDNECVNLMKDSKNCGSCNHRCMASGVYVSKAYCNGEGSCNYICRGGTVNCGTDQDPECKSILIDKNNCGRCGRSCSSGESCSSGVCKKF